MNKLIDILAQYPNLAATLFGFAAAIISGILGYFIKRPLQRQALATELFKTQIEGFEALIATQAAQLAAHQSTESIRDAIEGDLRRRLRECEERYGLRGEC